MKGNFRIGVAAFALALALAALGAGEARAQPVNAESLRPNPLEGGWTGGVSTNIAVQRGNVELLDLGGVATIQYQTLQDSNGEAHQPGESEDAKKQLPFIDQRVFLRATTRFAERGDATFINNGFYHLRWTGMWNPRIGSDAFAQLSFNEFVRLRERTVAGLGVRAVFWHKPAFMLWGGSAYMFEHETIDVAEGADDEPTTYDHRLSNYLSARLELADSKFRLQNTVFAQPRLDKPSDIRILEEFELADRITESFSLGITFSILYDSDPPTGVKSTDLRISNRLSYNF